MSDVAGMTNFHLVAAGIDVAPLLSQLADQPALWKLVTVRQEYEGTAHADSETIFARAPTDLSNVLDCTFTETVPAVLDALPSLLSVLREVDEWMDVRVLGRVMIVKLHAGGKVLEHTDEGAYARFFSRFHIPLIGQCRFTCGAEANDMMRPGDLWWFNHQLPHSVENGDSDRIHLIFDAVVPGFNGALPRG